MAQLVNIVEVCKVAPPQGSPKEQSFPLIFFDLIWLKFPPAQCLIFYKTTTSNPNTFSHSLLPKLKHSLSLTLHHYLPLAGNLIWPQPSSKPLIKYVEGDAVSLTIDESSADFNQLFVNDVCEATACHPLLSHLEASHDKAAVFAVQLTLFPNSDGFCIGISTHHSILDGRSTISFIKSWAHICSHIVLEAQLSSPSLSLPVELQPFYDRSVLKYLVEFDEIYTNKYSNDPNNRSLMPWELRVPPNSIRGTFELTRANIEKLRQMVNTEMANKEKPIHMSSFSVSCAYAWFCLVKAEETKLKKVFLVFSRDCRSRLEPPIPTTYFGNCMRATIAVAETKDIMLGKEGFVVAVKAISTAIKEGLENGALNGVEKEASFWSSLQGEGKAYGVSGSPRFELHKVDFGWRKPLKVDVISIDRTEAMSVLDSRNGDGGVLIGIVLNKHPLKFLVLCLLKDFNHFGNGEHDYHVTCLFLFSSFSRNNVGGLVYMARPTFLCYFNFSFTSM